MNLISRAIHLRELHRHEEAQAMLVQYLSTEPEDAEGHLQLALTRLEMDGQRRSGLESVNTAIGLEPDDPMNHAIKSLILGKLDKETEAIRSADEAIAKDPYFTLGWTAKASALGGLQRWKEAETCARRALEVDPDDDSAQNLLAVYLRAQGKVEEAEIEVQRRLSRDPEDPMTHANAGWAALQNGRRDEAEVHLAEALRLDPELEYARLGLREAYKSRSLFYRLYLKWVFFLQKYSEKQQILIFIGLYLGFKVGRSLLEKVNPIAAGVLVVVYLFLVFGSYLASGIGSFLLLKDPLARLSLNQEERREGIFVGGGFILGVLLIIGGLAIGHVPVALCGGGLVAAGIPASLFFGNESKIGRAVFGFAMLVVYLASAAVLLDSFIHPEDVSDWVASLGGFALLAAFGSTWLAMIPSLRRGPEE